MPKFDLITIGDATIDTFLQIEEATVNCSLQKSACQLCVNYADKIPVKNIARMVAGNAANCAVGAARLGLKTTLCSILGNDESGEWIQRKLKDEKVDRSLIQLDKKARTNLSMVLSFQKERTIFVYHAPRKYKLPKLPPAKMIYYTSVGEHHTAYNKEIVAAVKNSGARLMYNPGTYQLRAGLSAMKPILAICDTLFVNKEEAMRLVGPKDDIKNYLQALRSHGPRQVVITDGPNGSYCFEDDHFYKLGVPNTPVVERTGAGDAFAAGFIAAMFHHRPISEALCWGTMNSSSVIEQIGPQAGLLTLAGMQKFHKKTKHTCAVIL